MIKVRAHTSYLGKTGYSYHSRNLFRELSKYVDLRIHNFTWDDDISYLNDIDKNIIDSFSIKFDDNTYDHWVKPSYLLPDINWKHESFEFEPDIDIVLVPENHYYYFQEFKGKIKIAYCVWESTLLSESFVEYIKSVFDYFLVVSKWHGNMLINQGIDKNKIIILHEGVSDEFDPEYRIERDDNKFQFILFGKWEYRKSTTEIIKTFNEVFKNIEDVELILNVDNNYTNESTIDKINELGLNIDKIKIESFLSRDQYVNYVNNADCFISCSRSEGWNIPLIESMRAGIPVIYSNYGAQLEFAKGNSVKIKGLKSADNVPGLYCEPNFNNLGEVMLDIYNNKEDKFIESIDNVQYIKDNFNWFKIGKDFYSILSKIN